MRTSVVGWRTNREGQDGRVWEFRSIKTMYVVIQGRADLETDTNL